jgi:LPXTG-site transpeptidase (sortase) family protein
LTLLEAGLSLFATAVLIAVVAIVFVTRSSANGGFEAGWFGDNPAVGGRSAPLLKASTSAYAGRKGVWASPANSLVPLGRLWIPSLDVRAKFRLGVDDRVVRLGPGLWPGTPLPGVQGNAVLAGHRTSYTHPFGDLDLLEHGDVIRTRARGSQATVFRVFKVTTVPEAGYQDFVLRQPQSPEARVITLFACTPKGFRTHRIVVRARVETGSIASRSHGSNHSSTGRIDAA